MQNLRASHSKTTYNHYSCKSHTLKCCIKGYINVNRRLCSNYLFVSTFNAQGFGKLEVNKGPKGQLDVSLGIAKGYNFFSQQTYVT